VGGVGGEKNGAGKHHEQEHGFVIVLELFQRKKNERSQVPNQVIYTRTSRARYNYVDC
jgi:hypothetical protein